MIGIGPVLERSQAMSLFIRSIPFNFYAIFSFVLVALIARKIIPDFGPMRKAESRAMEKGEVLRPLSVPMMSQELTSLAVSDTGRPNIWLNFYAPVIIVIVVNLGTFIATGQAQVLNSFMLAVLALGVVMLVQRVDSVLGLMQTALAGVKGVMPAVLILALAYAINSVSRDMGTAGYVMEASRGWFNPVLLPLVTFVLSAFISFATGTSWATYAIMIPIAVPLAFEFSAGGVSLLVLCTIAAAAGGGVFGDHCSPLSDTTILSSLGSACDHMDHVKTQFPYALVVAGLVAAIYVLMFILI